MKNKLTIMIFLAVFLTLAIGLLLMPDTDETMTESPAELTSITPDNESPVIIFKAPDNKPVSKVQTPVATKKITRKPQTKTKQAASKSTPPRSKTKPKVSRSKSKPSIKSTPENKTPAVAHAGVILFTTGKVSAKSKKGKVRVLSRGSEVRVGDIITTGKNSQAQIRAGDGSMFALNAGSKLKIIEHNYTGTVEEQSSLIELVKGGMRAVTGLIGKNKPENFKIKVKQATIGIRGTEFVIQLCDNDCKKDSGGREKNGVYVGVLSGAVEVEQKEQKVQLDASLKTVMGVSMGIDKTKKQYVFIGEKKDAKVEALPKPPEVILQALAPPPVKVSTRSRKKSRTHSLPLYSGLDSEVFAAHITATRPIEKALSAVDEFDSLAYPNVPDVFLKNRFIHPLYKGIDTNNGSTHSLMPRDFCNPCSPPP